jgi:hypothetical protein
MEHIKITIEYKRYICELCGQSFQSGHKLNKHKKDCSCQEKQVPSMTMEEFKLKVTNSIDTILNELK